MTYFQNIWQTEDCLCDKARIVYVENILEINNFLYIRRGSSGSFLLYLYTGWSRNLHDFSGASDSRTRKKKKGFERILSNFQPSTHRGIKNFKKKLKSPLFFKMKYVSFFIHH